MAMYFLKIRILGALALGFLGGCTAITTDALETGPNVNSILPQISSTVPTASTSSNTASNTSDTTFQALPAEPKLEVAALPSSFTVGQAPLTLSAEVILADGSRSDKIGYELDDESLAKLEKGQLIPLKAGTLTLDVFSLDDPDLRQQIFIKITAPVTNTAPDPTPMPSVAPDYNELSDHFLDYQVGMKWSYTLSFGGAVLETLTTSEGEASFPAIIELSGGLTLENATEFDAEEKIQALVDDNLLMAIWDLEVIAAEENSVTIRSTLTSNTEGISSQDAIDTTYTPETLKLLYGSSPAQKADANNLQFNLLAKNQSLDTGVLFGQVTVDKFVAQQRLTGTTGVVERSELAMDRNRGLIQQIVTTSSEQTTVKVDSRLILTLLSFSDGSSPEEEPTSTL